MAQGPGAGRAGGRGAAEQGAGVFYWMLKVVLSPFLRTFWRPWIEGPENVPAEGPAILASNHLSFLDSIFLPLMVPRRVTFLAKIDYFTGSGLKGRAKRMFFSGVGQLPIDRSGGKASDAALRSGVRVLSQGKLLGIYPEGTRSPDGRLYRGKIGVARMALEAKVPVIPVAMFGTFEVQPQGRTIPRIRKVGMRIGRPLDFSRYEDMADDRFVLRSITDEIMYELMQLSGQEYVDMYAQKAKDDLATARAAATAAAAEAGVPAGSGVPARSAKQIGEVGKPGREVVSAGASAAEASPAGPAKPAKPAKPAGTPKPPKPAKPAKPGKPPARPATFAKPGKFPNPLARATGAPPATATARAGASAAEHPATDVPPPRPQAPEAAVDLPPDPLQR